MIPLSLDPNGEREAVKPVEECARAVMVADACGLYHQDRGHCLCDDVRFEGVDGYHADCDCREAGTAVLTRLRQLGFITLEGIQAIHAEEDANGVPRSSVLPGQNGSKL